MVSAIRFSSFTLTWDSSLFLFFNWEMDTCSLPLVLLAVQLWLRKRVGFHQRISLHFIFHPPLIAIKCHLVGLWCFRNTFLILLFVCLFFLFCFLFVCLFDFVWERVCLGKQSWNVLGRWGWPWTHWHPPTSLSFLPTWFVFGCCFEFSDLLEKKDQDHFFPNSGSLWHKH